MKLCNYICICLYMYVTIYIYMSKYVCMINIYIYIHIYTYVYDKCIVCIVHVLKNVIIYSLCLLYGISTIAW